MTYTRQQLIDALCAEYEHLCHDDYDPDQDLSLQEYRLKLECYSDDDLITETSVDKHFTIEEFMEIYGN